MASTLIITSVEKLQGRIEKALKGREGHIGIYVSLNKTQKSAQEQLEKAGIDTDRLFFIDCVTSEQSRPDVLHVAPTDLSKLNFAINSFIKEIGESKFLIVDALSTLLIYNDENKVAQFVKDITGHASRNDVEVIALSPQTKGEELLNKIFNFFDKVEKG